MLSIRGSELPTYKVVLLGEQGAGKSCLVEMLKSVTGSRTSFSVYKPTVVAKVHYHTFPGLCNFYIVDIAGKTEVCSTSIKDIYLRYADCVMLVFALDEPGTLEKLRTWNEDFMKNFKGDVKSVYKVVVGTKLDRMRDLNTIDGVRLQEKASLFASSINAVFFATSSVQGTDVRDTFLKIGQVLVQRHSMLVLKNKQSYKDNPYQDEKVLIVSDELRCAASDIVFPEPILIQHGEGRVLDISMSNTEQGIVLRVEKETSKVEQLLWKLPNAENCTTHEPDLVPVPQKINNSRDPCNELWKCLMSTNPVSVWQYEGLDSLVPITSTVRRQPTNSHLRGIKNFLFSSSYKGVTDKDGGLFYMLLLDDQDKLMEFGLTPALSKQGLNLSSMTLRVKWEFIIKPKPVHLPGNENVDSFSLSPTHAAVSLSNGNVLAWGNVKSGALGLEEHQTRVEHTNPVEISSNLLRSKVIQVSCGMDFTLILTKAGDVFSCGSGAFGKLGHGDQENKFLPTKVENLRYVKAICAGHHHSIALTRSVVYSWGLQCPPEGTDTFDHQLTPKRLRCNDDLWIEQISAGAYHSLCIGTGILFGGAAYTWGLGSSGQLGWGVYKNLKIPRCVQELYSKKKVKVRAVSGGLKHSAFLTSKGDVFTCGNNSFGQLGYLTENKDVCIPRKVDLGTNALGVKVRAIDLRCSDDCTMVRTEDEDILIWGKCSYGPVLPDPHGICIKETSLIDVATVYIPCSYSMLELSLGLTCEGQLMLCSVNQSGCDHCTIDACHEKLVPCSNRTKGLVRMTAATNILVTVDKEGRVYYADVYCWIRSFMNINSEVLANSNTPPLVAFALHYSSKLEQKNNNNNNGNFLFFLF